MRLINPSVEIIPQEEGLLGVYKQIELAGRTCYKSENNITEDSCKEFVQRMINSGHTAMLEHGSIYLKVPINDIYLDRHEWEYMFPEDCPWVDVNSDSDYCYISTNYRHIMEREVGLPLVQKYMCPPTEYHQKRVTVRFTCDRGVSHELVRHRVFSFAQESTRYCNYSRDKFNNQLTFIIPSWAKTMREGTFNDNCCTDWYWSATDGGDSMKVNEQEMQLMGVFNKVEMCYLEGIKLGLSPQQIRQILPNALKTEVVMTGFVSDWEYFFSLRCAPNAHPDMQYLAKQLKEEFVKLGFCND